MLSYVQETPRGLTLVGQGQFKVNANGPVLARLLLTFGQGEYIVREISSLIALTRIARPELFSEISSERFSYTLGEATPIENEFNLYRVPYSLYAPPR